MKKVIVGLSGGVDSSVSALLLKEQGYEVIGLFMKNWHDESLTISNDCPWLEDSNDAMLVANKLNIPFQTIDLSKEYQSRIINYMFDEYKMGKTPNPDILCNREIKFDIFLKLALNLGADYVATGHYCQVESFDKNNKKIYRLLSGDDHLKDQSYFLCQLTQNQLSKVIFPIGKLTKKEVREIAKKNDLVTAEKKDSQGLCFVGKVKLPDFLKQKLTPKKGKVIKVDNNFIASNKEESDFESNKSYLESLCTPQIFSETDGKYIGDHNGAFFYTVGQRKGIDIGGFKDPLFVIMKDIDKNILYVGMGSDHPALFKKALFISKKDIHWVRNDLTIQPNQSMEVYFRVRYRQPLEKGKIFMYSNGLFILFDRPISSIASGQFASWYIENELIGSGMIS